jgi:putative ABC transport system permease protein
MGIPILRGRGFSPADTESTAKVALLSQATVNRYWPGGDPLGARIAFAHDPTWRTVVGITGSVKYLGLDRDPEPEIYLPLPQMDVPYLDISLVVRSQADAALLAIPVERAVHDIDPNLTVSDVKTIDELLAKSTAPQRFNAILLASFSVLAGLLAFGGLYSTLLYLVSQRTREMGLRIALGAQRRDLAGLLLSEGGRMALFGIAIGCLAAASLGRVLKVFLFGLSPLDPATYALVGVGMLFTAMLASAIPAWRASRVDPMTALRSD